MIPYFRQPEIHVYGGATLHAFGTLVVLAVVVGWAMGIRRCRKTGLDAKFSNRMLIYAVVAGFLAAHLYSLLAYHPERILHDPAIVMKFWENLSSLGGIVGGMFGLWLCFRVNGRLLTAVDRWRYVDAVAYVFPFAWAIGRLGCALAHDHPGTITKFPLGVSLATPASRAYIRYSYLSAGRLPELPDMRQLSGLGFHDLGWYEFLYTALVIVPAFLVLDQKPRQPGFFALAFLLLYVPARFLLDFLRLTDARYAGLTPAQYAGAVVFFGALYFGMRGGSPLKK